MEEKMKIKLKTLAAGIIGFIAFGFIACDNTLPHEHSYGDWQTVKVPTCTENGKEERSCECGEKETRDVKAKGHSFGDWTTVEDPTCTEKGRKERSCDCGEIDFEEILAAGHDLEKDEFGNVVMNSVETAPTCMRKGKGKATCNTCGEVDVDIDIDPDAHEEGKMHYDMSHNKFGINHRDCINTDEDGNQCQYTYGKGVWSALD